MGLEWNHPDISIDNIWQNLGEDANNNGFTIYQDANGNILFDFGDLNGIDDDGNGKIDDLAGFNFVQNNYNIYSNLFDDQHGINMFGLIAAEADNLIGAAGSSFNSTIIFCKAGSGGYITGNWVQAIQYLANQGAKIISMSFFGPGYMQSTQDVINYAYQNGSILVACGGYSPPVPGCPTHALRYPIGYDNVIGVGVLNEDANTMRLTSIVSSKIDLLLSRLAVYPAIINDQFSYANSIHTSGTTAITAGVLSLLKAHYPSWTNDQIVNQIFATAVNKEDYNTSNNCNFDFTGLIGHGLLDAEYALTFDGTIDRDLIWNKELKLYHNIVVEAGKTLIIRDGTQLTFMPGKTFNVYGNLIVEGNLTINRNINVNSGGRIEINPGAKIIFEDNSKIQVYGNIICNGTANNPIELDFVQLQSVYDQGVTLGNSCDTASFQYTTIKNSRYGIKSDHAYFSFKYGNINNTFIAIYADYAKPLIEYNNFLDCAYGVRIHNSNYVSGTEAKILNNTFYINTEIYTSYAVYLYYSSPEIRNNEIQNYQFGVLCANYSSAKLGQEYLYGFNNVFSNEYALSSSNSNPFLGALYTGGPTNGRYNGLYDNTGYNITASYSSNILAYGNWWGSADEREFSDKFYKVVHLQYIMGNG